MRVFLLLLQTQTPMTLTLDSARALAYQANPGLGIMRQRLIEARSREQQRWTAYFPRLGVDATLTQVGSRQTLAIPPGALGPLSTGELVPGRPIVLPQGGKTLFLQTVRVEQPVTQLFKVRAGHRAAEAEERSAEAQLRGAEGDLSLGVELGYSNLLVAKAQYRAQAVQVAADSALARDARASTEVGLALSVAADQADARLHESRRRFRELGYRIEDLGLELADLLGIPPSTTFELVTPPDDSAFTGSLEDYVTGALASNPEVVAATQQVVRASQGVSAARAEYLPQVGVFAQHLLQHAVPFLPASHFSVGVKAEWTIWDFRQRDFAMAERRAQREQARLDLERTRRRIETETTKAYRALLRAKEGASVAAEAAAARTAAARIAADQVAAGLALPSVALSAEATRLLAETDLLQARFTIRLAHAALDRVAGHDPR